MDSNLIQTLKENGERIVTIDNGRPFLANNAEFKLRAKIAALYVKVGMQRSLTPERFSEEVNMAAHTLASDIVMDKMYWSLRFDEIDYCFNNGLKGRLDKDGRADVVVTYKTIIRWIENYIKHPMYVEAMKSINNKPVPVTHQIGVKKYTDKDYAVMVKVAFDDYKEFKEKKRLMCQSDDRLKNIGELFGLPITCRDYGKLRMNWLIENGYAEEGETIVAVFERALAGNGKIEKI